MHEQVKEEKFIEKFLKLETFIDPQWLFQKYLCCQLIQTRLLIIYFLRLLSQTDLGITDKRFSNFLTAFAR